MSPPRSPAVDLHPAEPVLPALKRLLRRECAALRRHAAALAQDDDDEALHDFRVTLRRSRTLFGRCRAAFPPAVVRRFHEPLRALARQSGARRDLDVLLADLPCQDENDETAALREWLVTRRAAAQRTLLATLGGEGGRLLQEWEGWLTAPHAPAALPVAAARPLVPFARRTLRRALDALGEGCAALTSAPAARQLHRVRILGKRVRYLLEFFAPLFPAEAGEGLRRQLKALQELLGRYQDGISQHALLRPPPHAAGVLRRGARRERARVRQRQKELLPAVLAAVAGFRPPGRHDSEIPLGVAPGPPPSSPLAREVAMKELTLIRHAKAQKTARRGGDRARPLRKRGLGDARALAGLLSGCGWSAPLVITSGALRARETADLLFPASAAVVAEELYPGDPEALLAVLRALPADCQHAVLVGHHPALTELWNRLSGEDCDKLPTCCCHSLRLTGESWAEAVAKRGEIVLRHSPRAPALPLPLPAAETPAPRPKATPRGKGGCRKGVSEAEERPGNYRCRKCKAVSDHEKRLCAPEKLD